MTDAMKIEPVAWEYDDPEYGMPGMVAKRFSDVPPGRALNSKALVYQSSIDAAVAAALAERDARPIDMILHCPACGMQHVDAPESGSRILYADEPINDQSHGTLPGWANPPHRSHLCSGCGHIWRPADVPTNGVAAIKTQGKNDSPKAERDAEIERLRKLLAEASEALRGMQWAQDSNPSCQFGLKARCHCRRCASGYAACIRGKLDAAIKGATDAN
jgi:hypothetical protein